MGSVFDNRRRLYVGVMGHSDAAGIDTGQKPPTAASRRRRWQESTGNWHWSQSFTPTELSFTLNSSTGNILLNTFSAELQKGHILSKVLHQIQKNTEMNRRQAIASVHRG